ncbi:MAG: molybdopterin-dependent oxidoreductase, partial [Chloroflexi bacterium]|nr:molybdopterin-dependent oxidoreductase [Chloroflexota bacterium]
MTNSIREMRDADCILMTGTNTAENHPVISYEVVRAARKGANIIVIDPRRVPMVDNATLFLQIKPGTDVYIFMAMMHIIYREGWANESFIAEQTEGYAEFLGTLEQYTPEYASLMSGVPVEKIEAVARIYANGERVSGESVYEGNRGHSAIMYAMGITQRSSGTDIVKILANLTMMSGQIGKLSAGMNPLRGQSNVQGACDVGGLVNVYPGYQKVTDDEKRAVIEELWATPNLPSEIGRTIVEASHDVMDGSMRVNYVMGENPIMSEPDTTHVEKALRALDFLVVQDIFPNDTATLAHVILPAASGIEKDGTFTNTERRVQQLAPVLPSPGMARQDWAITAEIAKRFDEKMGIERADGYWDFADSSAIFDELTTVTPIYGGMDYGRIQEEGLQW